MAFFPVGINFQNLKWQFERHLANKFQLFSLNNPQQTLLCVKLKCRTWLSHFIFINWQNRQIDGIHWFLLNCITIVGIFSSSEQDVGFNCQFSSLYMNHGLPQLDSLLNYVRLACAVPIGPATLDHVENVCAVPVKTWYSTQSRLS